MTVEAYRKIQRPSGRLPAEHCTVDNADANAPMTLSLIAGIAATGMVTRHRRAVGIGGARLLWFRAACSIRVLISRRGLPKLSSRQICKPVAFTARAEFVDRLGYLQFDEGDVFDE